MNLFARILNVSVSLVLIFYSFVAAAAIPAPPTNLSVTNVLPTGFISSWTASAGATGYRVDVSIFSDFSQNIITDLAVTDTKATISGLSPNTQYNFRVRATNGSGISPNSAIFSLLLPRVAPTIVARDIGSNSFNVFWTGGGTSFRFDMATSSDFTTGILFNDLSVTELDKTVAGLSPLTTYYCRVRVRNTGGFDSPNSNVLAVTTTPEVPVISSIAPQHTRFVAEWTPAAGANSYEFQWSTFPDFSQNFDFSLADTRLTVLGLQANTTYYCRVRAGSALGITSAFSSIVTVTTTPTPDIPIFTSQPAPIDAHSFKASWFNASAADSYFFEYAKSPDFSDLTTIPVSATTITVSNLTLNTTYYCRIRAHNAFGDSPNSNVLSVKTLNFVPAPINLIVAPLSNKAFSATWNPSVGASAYIFEFASAANFSNSTSFAVNSPSTGQGNLTPGATYFCRVRGVASDGTASSFSLVASVTLPLVAPILELSGTSFPAVSACGQTFNINVTSNTSWTVDFSTEDQAPLNFVTVSPSSGTGNGVLTVNVDVNTAFSPRDFSFAVKTNDGIIARFVSGTQGDEFDCSSNVPSGENLSVYPNPVTNDLLNISGQLNVEGSYDLTILNASGAPQLTQSSHMKRGLNSATMDLHNLKPGLYLLKVRSPEGKVQTIRFEKKN